jgi:hypothetical protein
MGNRFGYVPLGMVLLFILIRIGYRYEWTGFAETARPKSEKSEIQPRKTLWDWMSLLLVPAMIALLGFGLTWWQTNSQRAMQAEEQARQEALRAQNTALQTYLDQMSELLLQTDLRHAEVDSEVRIIAQARTSAVLAGLGPANIRTLLRFLSAASLVQGVDQKPPIISLAFADLSNSNLTGIALSGAYLRAADLSAADLSKPTWTVPT